MHKQHEDQPSNELPNLSTWHRVPVGATILASGNDLPPHTLLTREGGRWLTRYGAEWTVKITSWCPVTVGLMVPMP